MTIATPKPNQPTNSQNTKNTTNSKNKPLYSVPLNERTELIKTAYKKALGREPTNLELSRYKFSSLTYLQLLETLLNTKEHNDLITLSKNTKTLQLKNEHLVQEIEMLRNELNAKRNELQNFQALLKIKNQTISDLRKMLQQQQNLSNTPDKNPTPPDKKNNSNSQIEGLLRKFIKDK